MEKALLSAAGMLATVPTGVRARTVPLKWPSPRASKAIEGRRSFLKVLIEEGSTELSNDWKC